MSVGLYGAMRKIDLLDCCMLLQCRPPTYWWVQK